MDKFILMSKQWKIHSLIQQASLRASCVSSVALMECKDRYCFVSTLEKCLDQGEKLANQMVL